MQYSKHWVWSEELKTKITTDRAKIFPEGAIGYFLGPTLAMLTSSIMANYFNAYLSNVLNINKWAGWFFTWMPVVSVFFVILGNILVGRLMDRMRLSAGKARPLILLSIPHFCQAMFPDGQGNYTTAWGGRIQGMLAIRAAMPWIFIGGETIGFGVIFVLFLFMKVEDYADEDRAALSARRI